MKKIMVSSLLLISSYGMADDLLADNSRSLSQRELHSITLAKEWLDNGNKSFRGEDGSVSFLYGATMPRIIVAPLKITDIQFQVGEKIKDVQLGDTTRWMTSPSISGDGKNQISHLLVKTTDVGLETTLFVSTNKRTYHMNLFSRKYEYMPIVGFKYKDEINQKWDAYNNHFKKEKKIQQASKSFKITSALSKNIDSLDFEYTITGETSWKPLRVYNDGIKTYIQMPSSMKYQEAPIFMVLDKGDNNQLVNYRLKENNYIVDKLFKKGMLIIGVGEDQEKIIITQKGLKQSTNLWGDDDEQY
jgi:type IV secretion system protein VirB9